MEKFILNMHHVFNPLHIYCRLIGAGMNRYTAQRVCRYYETFIFKWFNEIDKYLHGPL
jgi:hypothetical protein